MLHVEAQPTSTLTPPERFTQMGKALPRIDIPAKVTGGAAYIQDMRLPGMVHARVVRPPSNGATLLSADTAADLLPGLQSYNLPVRQEELPVLVVKAQILRIGSVKQTFSALFESRDGSADIGRTIAADGRK